jgi:hypothetical protein
MDTPTPQPSKRKKLANIMHDPINPESNEIQPGDIVRYNKVLHEVVRLECDAETQALFVVLFGDKSKKRIPIEDVELVDIPGFRQKDYQDEMTEEDAQKILKAVEEISQRMRVLQTKAVILSASQEEIKHNLHLLMQLRFGYDWTAPKFPNPIIATQSGYGLTTVLLALRSQTNVDYICLTPQSWICVGASKSGTLEHLSERLKGDKPAIIQLKNLHTFSSSAQREDSTWMVSVKEEIKMLLSGKAPSCHNAFVIGSGYWDVVGGKVKIEDDTYEDSWSKTSKQDTSVLKYFASNLMIMEGPAQKDCEIIFKDLTKDDRASASFSNFYELGEKLLQYRMDQPMNFLPKSLDK